MQFGHEVEDTAVGQNHFQPQTKGAGGTVAHDVGAAGVGGQNAVPIMAEPRAPNHKGKYEAMGFGSVVEGLQDDSGLDNRDAGVRADFADFVEAFDR